MMQQVNFEDIQQAARRIEGRLHRTPVLTSRFFNTLTDVQLFFKCENFQRTGAFKARGALNAVSQLTKSQLAKGVVTHSSGNHGAALAFAAAQFGTNADIVMPKDSSEAKKQAVAHYGGRVTLCKNQEERASIMQQIQKQTGATVIHPFDDPHVIAGQGTAALELIEEIKELDTLITPVGGGGLVSGTAVATACLLPNAKTFGGEPENAGDAAASFNVGKICDIERNFTIADGLRGVICDNTFAHISRHISDIITVAEEEIISATRLVWQRMKIVIEPSSAVALAAIIKRAPDFAGQRVGIIISGGNVDLDRLPW